MSVAFALSIHHFINSVGADAGFAAIIGLAILVLLFFAQARETASLRDRAAESDEHVHQLELRLAQLSRAAAPAPVPPGVARPGVAPAPAGPRAASASTPVAGALVSAIPAAPAGVGAPALSSATRLIPDHVISIRANDPAAPSPVVAGAAAVAGVVAATGTAAQTGLAAATTETTAGGGDDSRGPVLASGLPPATAAGGANGGSTGRVPPPVAVPRPAGAGRIQSGSVPPPPLVAGRPGAGHPPSGRRRGIVLAVIGAMVIAAAVVVALVLTRGSGGSNHSTKAARSTHNAGRHRTVAQLASSDVKVTVLNGTSTNNLAHDITKRLDAGGYKTGTPMTASNQTHTTTIVGYTRSHRAAALLVAKSLALGRTAVQPVAADDLQVACPQASACPVQVIVTLGTDLASAATSTTITTTST